MYIKMSQKCIEACRSRFIREMRYSHAIDINEKFDINETKRLVNKAKDRCKELYITDDEYEKFSIDYYKFYTGNEEQIAIKSKCLKWMKHIQSHMCEKVISELSCIKRHSGCSKLCVDLEEAKETQVEWFDCGLNVNDGSVIKIDMELCDEVDKECL